MAPRQRITVVWDDRLNALTDAMQLCRTKGFHDWMPAGATDIVYNRAKKPVAFVQHWRCDRGCETTKLEHMEILGQAIRRVGNPRYDWDPRYKIEGEPIDRDLLRQELYMRANPELLAFLRSKPEE